MSNADEEGLQDCGVACLNFASTAGHKVCNKVFAAGLISPSLFACTLAMRCNWRSVRVAATYNKRTNSLLSRIFSNDLM